MRKKCESCKDYPDDKAIVNDGGVTDGKCLNQEKRDRELLKKQTSKIEEDINNIKKKGIDKIENVFKMKELIGGSKKAGQEPTAIKDPVTNELIVSND